MSNSAIAELAIKSEMPPFFVWVYLSSLIFIGITYLSIMPIFEGFDESAHYSSLRQISGTGTIPVYGKSYMDTFVVDFKVPIHYNTGTSGLDQDIGYPTFFNQPELVEHYQQTVRVSSPLPDYQPSHLLNYQAQHPPAYYLLLAPWSNIFDHFSFSSQIFLLRLISYLLAIGGVVFGLLAVNQSKYASEVKPKMVGFLFYPIVLPMFFPEFTRIGNDSLCLLLVGLTAYFFSLWFKDEHSIKKSIVVGTMLGIGLLTKALFVPIIGGVMMFLLIRSWGDQHKRVKRWSNVVQILLPILILGGSWYAYKLMVFGQVDVSNEATLLARQGGMMAGLKNNFTVYEFVRGLIAPFATYSWAGTVSIAHLPAILQIPLLVLALWIFMAAWRQLKNHSVGDVEKLFMWVFLFFAAGLLWHIVVCLALVGKGGTPGWYLHILMPWVAPFIGLGVVAIFQEVKARLWLIILLMYAVFFHVMVLWSQFALFTGCAGKDHLNGNYVFSGNFFCFDQASILFDRIAVLGYPSLAVVGLVGGVITNVWLFRQVMRNTTSLKN